MTCEIISANDGEGTAVLLQAGEERCDRPRQIAALLRSRGHVEIPGGKPLNLPRSLVVAKEEQVVS